MYVYTYCTADQTSVATSIIVKYYDSKFIFTQEDRLYTQGVCMVSYSYILQWTIGQEG